ncbi:CRISPR-associated endonuclease Cas1 [Rhizobium sp. FKY42]|uniref:CRISPR-associated endonuclease Cas1 n=1 Tax=Rhizobium sp. FKY42 TaxID=2562310 RepID=UPI0010BFA11E|nr:CRISPR-associated endonuclease Cas1 [Rhizobium sp. FKY42]
MDTSGPDLWSHITSMEALQEAWARVAMNEGGPGGDGISLEEFRRDLFGNLTQLRADLLAGSWRPLPHRKVAIPKKKPGYRVLTIPSIRDRVLHTAIAQALTPVLEPMFEDGSFAYRPGRGVQDAVRRIEHWRNRGYSIVIEADIVSYFDNVDVELLESKLKTVLDPLPGGAPVHALISAILAAGAAALATPGRGIVQGSPLSPLLANLHLDALDEEIEGEGVKIVRFADDFVILCKSEKRAEKVLQRCIAVLAEHNLRLHEDGTRIVNFDRGFDFIGYLFLRTLALQDKNPVVPDKPAKPLKSEVTDDGIIKLEERDARFDTIGRVLYLVDADHQLSVRNRAFSVKRNDGAELIAIPHGKVGRIEISKNVAFDHAAIDLALDAGIELAFFDGFGQTRGLVAGPSPRRAGLHLAQARAILDPTFAAALAAKLVDARIRNQRTQLMRLSRSRPSTAVDDALSAMLRQLRRVPHESTVSALRGHEGAATAAYWPALGATLENRLEGGFQRQRPASDPVNAAINYLTGILERDIRAAIQAASLHPGFACLHGTRDRHDGLVFDLMEPFRAPLTEGLAVYLFNARRLRPEMFSDRNDEGLLMNADARKALIVGYEAAVEKRINRTDGKGKLAWRPMMRLQAASLASAVLQANADLFIPYLMEA